MAGANNPSMSKTFAVSEAMVLLVILSVEVIDGVKICRLSLATSQ